MTELKPCPVCGSDNLYVMTVFPSGNHVFHCMDCHTYYDKLELTREDTRSDMLNKWNEYAQNYKPEPKSEPELKPCPFCGGPAKRYATDGHNTEWYVMCKDCGCSTKARHRGQDIEDWNRRVSE